MRRLLLVAISITAMIPLAAGAQGYPGMGGGHAGRGGFGRGGGRHEGAAAHPDSATLARMAERRAEAADPVMLLLDHRSELALTDSEVVSLQTLQQTTRAESERLTSERDSLRRAALDEAAHRPSDAATWSTAQMDSARAVRHAMGEVMARLRDDAANTVTQANALLTPAQRVAAVRLEDAARREPAEAPDAPAGEGARHGGPRGGRASPADSVSSPAA